MLFCRPTPCIQACLREFSLCTAGPQWQRTSRDLAGIRSSAPELSRQSPPPMCPGPKPIQTSATSQAVSKQLHKSPAPLPSDSCPRTGDNHHTHRSNCGPSSGQGSDMWSDCRTHPPTQASQETTQGKLPAVRSVLPHCPQTSGLTQSLQQPLTGELTTRDQTLPKTGTESHCRLQEKVPRPQQEGTCNTCR